MVERTILLSFLTASALALGIDPAIARRVAEDRIECVPAEKCANVPTLAMPNRISAIANKDASDGNRSSAA